MSSKLKKFLDRRSEGITQEKILKTGEDIKPTTTKLKTVMDHDLGFYVKEEQVEIEEESLDLSDDEFWDISNEFNKKIKNSKEKPFEVLQTILEKYTPLKIEQFAKRYKELNS